MPLAVTMATEAIFEAHYSQDRAKMLFHSSSYTANPIACAAANANLAIWREEPVLERVAALARQQSARMRRLAAGPGLSGARTLGTIAAIEIMGENGYLSSLAPGLLRFFRDHDLLVRPLGNTLYVMPPYCIDDAQLDFTYAALAEASSRARSPRGLA